MPHLFRKIAPSMLALSLSACTTLEPARQPVAPAPVQPVAQSPAQAQAPATAAPSVGSNTPEVLYDWNFITGDPDGWSLGWSSSDAMAFTGFEATDKTGLKLTADFQAKNWADANIRAKWTDDAAPEALRVRMLIPATEGRPRGPLNVGCALHEPWAEAKHWVEVKLPERVVMDGKDYLSQTLTCRLGKSTARHKSVVLRFGGLNVRFKGTIYLQSIRALSKA